MEQIPTENAVPSKNKGFSKGNRLYLQRRNNRKTEDHSGGETTEAFGIDDAGRGDSTDAIGEDNINDIENPHVKKRRLSCIQHAPTSTAFLTEDMHVKAAHDFELFAIGRSGCEEFTPGQAGIVSSIAERKLSVDAPPRSGTSGSTILIDYFNPSNLFSVSDSRSTPCASDAFEKGLYGKPEETSVQQSVVPLKTAVQDVLMNHPVALPSHWSGTLVVVAELCWNSSISAKSAITSFANISMDKSNASTEPSQFSVGVSNDEPRSQRKQLAHLLVISRSKTDPVLFIVPKNCANQRGRALWRAVEHSTQQHKGSLVQAWIPLTPLVLNVRLAMLRNGNRPLYPLCLQQDSDRISEVNGERKQVIEWCISDVLNKHPSKNTVRKLPPDVAKSSTRMFLLLNPQEVNILEPEGISANEVPPSKRSTVSNGTLVSTAGSIIANLGDVSTTVGRAISKFLPFRARGRNFFQGGIKVRAMNASEAEIVYNSPDPPNVMSMAAVRNLFGETVTPMNVPKSAVEVFLGLKTRVSPFLDIVPTPQPSEISLRADVDLIVSCSSGLLPDFVSEIGSHITENPTPNTSFRSPFTDDVSKQLKPLLDSSDERFRRTILGARSTIRGSPAKADACAVVSLLIKMTTGHPEFVGQCQVSSSFSKVQRYTNEGKIAFEHGRELLNRNFISINLAGAKEDLVTEPLRILVRAEGYDGAVYEKRKRGTKTDDPGMKRVLMACRDAIDALYENDPSPAARAVHAMSASVPGNSLLKLNFNIKLATLAAAVLFLYREKNEHKKEEINFALQVYNMKTRDVNWEGILSGSRVDEIGHALYEKLMKKSSAGLWHKFAVLDMRSYIGIGVQIRDTTNRVTLCVPMHFNKMKRVFLGKQALELVHSRHMRGYKGTTSEEEEEEDTEMDENKTGSPVIPLRAPQPKARLNTAPLRKSFPIYLLTGFADSPEINDPDPTLLNEALCNFETSELDVDDETKALVESVLIKYDARIRILQTRISREVSSRNLLIDATGTMVCEENILEDTEFCSCLERELIAQSTFWTNHTYIPLFMPHPLGGFTARFKWNKSKNAASTATVPDVTTGVHLDNVQYYFQGIRYDQPGLCTLPPLSTSYLTPGGYLRLSRLTDNAKALRINLTHHAVTLARETICTRSEVASCCFPLQQFDHGALNEKVVNTLCEENLTASVRLAVDLVRDNSVAFPTDTIARFIAAQSGVACHLFRKGLDALALSNDVLSRTAHLSYLNTIFDLLRSYSSGRQYSTAAKPFFRLMNLFGRIVVPMPTRMMQSLMKMDLGGPEAVEASTIADLVSPDLGKFSVKRTARLTNQLDGKFKSLPACSECQRAFPDQSKLHQHLKDFPSHKGKTKCTKELTAKSLIESFFLPQLDDSQKLAVKNTTS